MTAGLLFHLLAGEPSGDALGAALMRALKGLTGGAVRFAGVGGPLMEAEGLESLFPQSELAVMGLFEVLPRLPSILRRIDQTTEAVLAAEPDALITIDSPSFGLRVARRVRARASTLRTVHYVAPSVWAWRPGRAKKMAACVDQVLALLPFEPPYFTRHGIRCDFVGHPIAAQPQPGPAAQRALREEIGAPEDAPLVVALPGSRMGEVQRHGSLFRQTLKLLARRHPSLRVVTPTVPHIADAVIAEAARWPNAIVLDPRGRSATEAEARKRTAMAAADVALAASGTVTLELAAASTPMVAVYRANPLTAMIVRRLVKVDTANLVNLILGRRVAPEFLQEAFQPEAVAAALAGQLADGAAQRAAFEEAMRIVGAGGPPPAQRAAQAVLDGLKTP